MTKMNSLCHQRTAATAIIREQMERMERLDNEIAEIAGVTILGGFMRVKVEDFDVEIMRGRSRPPQVSVYERPVVKRETLAAAGAAGMACAEG